MCEHEVQIVRSSMGVIENVNRPFIIYALPRSRTNWLSRFLTFGDFFCYHEAAQYLRGFDDAKSLLLMDFTGFSETGAAPGWRLIHHYRPDIKAVVVRRPVDEVVESILALDVTGIGIYERERVTKTMRYLDRMLEQIEGLPSVLSVNFHDLKREEVCGQVFEHCLPYRFDPEWWRQMSALNLQVNSRALLRYRFANRPQMDRFKALCWAELRKLKQAGAFERGLAA